MTDFPSRLKKEKLDVLIRVSIIDLPLPLRLLIVRLFNETHIFFDLQDPIFGQMEGEGELALMAKIVDKSAYHAITFLDMAVLQPEQP